MQFVLTSFACHLVRRTEPDNQLCTVNSFHRRIADVSLSDLAYFLNPEPETCAFFPSSDAIFLYITLKFSLRLSSIPRVPNLGYVYPWGYVCLSEGVHLRLAIEGKIYEYIYFQIFIHTSVKTTLIVRKI